MATRDEALSYYKWLWRDFRANRKVQRMGYLAKGLYRELLDEAWVEGSIPNNMNALADICGCPVEDMREAWPSIAPCWIEDEHGRLVNEKLDSQRTEMDAKRVMRSQVGRLGGLVKTRKILEATNADESDIARVKQAEVETKEELAGAKQQLVDAEFLLDEDKQTQAIGKQTQAIGKQLVELASVCHIAYAEHTQEQEHTQSKSTAEISTPNGVSPRKSSGKSDPIEAIYQEYPRKVGKEAALKAISRAVDRLRSDLLNEREAQALLFRRTRSYARSPAGNRGELTPHPATWFNQGRYDDDPKEWEIGDGAQPSSTVTRGAVSPATQRVESGVNAFRKAAIDFGATDGLHGTNGGEIPQPGHGGGSAELPLRLQPASPKARVIGSQDSVIEPPHKAGAEILSQPGRDSRGAGIYDR